MIITRQTKTGRLKKKKFLQAASFLRPSKPPGKQNNTPLKNS